MPWQPEARHKTQVRNWTPNTCQDQEHVYVCTLYPLFVFDLFYVRQEKHQKVLLSFWNSLILSNVCVIIGMRRIRHLITRRLDKVQQQHTLTSRTIHNYANVLFVFVFFCDASKASENLTFILNKVWFWGGQGWQVPVLHFHCLS